MPWYNKTIMSIFSQIAQSSTYYDTMNGSLYSTTSPEEEAAAAAFGVFMVISLIVFAIITYVVVSLSLMKIFKKAGVKPWIAWVPFYNQWKMLEIGGQKGFWVVFSPFPFLSLITLVFMYIAMYHIGKKLSKGDAFVVLGIFLPLVWYIWLAVDKSTWNDKATDAPSLAK
jgi:hypothetical protein